MTAFVQGLQELGWTDGRNVRIDTRWAAGDADRTYRYVAELIALAPDVFLASGGTVRGTLAPSDPRRAGRVHAARSIRSAPASSPAWRGRAAMLPDLPGSNTASARNGLNCSKRSHRA